MNKVGINGNDVPIGALVSFIQKGFQFMELEANLNEEGTDVYGKYINLTARDILTKDLKELREVARELKIDQADLACAVRPSATVQPNGLPSKTVNVDISLEDLKPLPGHENAEVNALSWSASANMLATACADGVARIWSSDSDTCTKCQPSPLPNSDALEVLVAAEWDPNGSVLATATDSGRILLWDVSGAQQHSLDAHRAGVLALQWSKTGTVLASGSADGIVALWDPSTGHKRVEWTLPGGTAVFDMDWRDDVILAVAGQDGTVALYSADELAILHVIKEHDIAGNVGDGVSSMELGGGGGPAYSGQVNAVRWAPQPHSFLATGSNDMTVGLLKFEEGEDGSQISPLSLLKGHKREVTVVAWRLPHGAGDEGTVPILASGSADGSVRLWDVEHQRCVGILDRHEDSIECLSWSPCSSFLATGDGVGNVTVWAVHKEGSGGIMLRTVRGNGQVADLQWAQNGKSLAVSFFGVPGVGLLSLKDLTLAA